MIYIEALMISYTFFSPVGKRDNDKMF